ncbi:MAG: hypothetical protein Sylvanvirus2_9 [Sylvanvirus sp.]|uniref:C962R-like N-terminal AEP domain-containing protein n=1 Tax=Sylvanvirus sp. TaxID=2487774 RepID=A0A3G5AK45_9VIRU|nr:MAG: hypothetical protein Sylvanvirus2_9 [Sylvanvirus sp.]
MVVGTRSSSLVQPEHYLKHLQSIICRVVQSQSLKSKNNMGNMISVPPSKKGLLDSSSMSVPLKKTNNAPGFSEYFKRIREQESFAALGSDGSSVNMESDRMSMSTSGQASKPSLEDWLQHHNFLIRVNDKTDLREQTHTCFDGMKLHIPDGRIGDFLHLIAFHQACGGGKWKICDIINPKCVRLYGDCDLKISKPGELSDAFILRRTAVYQNVVKRFFPEGMHQVIVAYAPGYKLIKDEKYPQGYYKHGIHWVWPDVVHTIIHIRQIAQTARDAFEAEFSNDIESNELCLNPMGDQMDKGVYKTTGGGLRMLYQSKMDDCPCTKTKRGRRATLECTICGTKGKIEEGRVYFPKFVVDEQGQVNDVLTMKVKQDIEWSLEKTTIRIPRIWTLRYDFVEPLHIRPLDDVFMGDLERCEVRQDVPIPQPLNIEACQRNYFSLASSGQPYLVMTQGSTCLSQLVIKTNELNEHKRIKELEKRGIPSALAHSDLCSNDAAIEDMRDTFRNHQSTGILMSLTAETKAQLESYIRDLQPEWKEVHLSKTIKFISSKTQKTNLQIHPRPDLAAKYCLNKMDYHSHARISWYVNADGFVFQKCYSSKETIRPGGNDTCRKFFQRLGQLPQDLAIALFGQPLLASQSYVSSSTASLLSQVKQLMHSDEQTKLLDILKRHQDRFKVFNQNLEKTNLKKFNSLMDDEQQGIVKARLKEWRQAQGHQQEGDKRKRNETLTSSSTSSQGRIIESTNNKSTSKRTKKHTRKRIEEQEEEQLHGED